MNNIIYVDSISTKMAVNQLTLSNYIIADRFNKNIISTDFEGNPTTADSSAQPFSNYIGVLLIEVFDITSAPVLMSKFMISGGYNCGDNINTAPFKNFYLIDTSVYSQNMSNLTARPNFVRYLDTAADLYYEFTFSNAGLNHTVERIDTGASTLVPFRVRTTVRNMARY